MSLIGLLVFAVSMLTAGFKTAFKRLIAFACAGLMIDLFIIGLAVLVGYVN